MGSEVSRPLYGSLILSGRKEGEEGREGGRMSEQKDSRTEDIPVTRTLNWMELTN